MEEAYVVLCAIGGSIPVAPSLYSFPYATKKAALEAMKWFKMQGAVCKLVNDVSDGEESMP